MITELNNFSSPQGWTPKGFRLHIGIFGRRNAGKSSLLNALARQQVSIVSNIAGTTTDPVEKAMEFLPIGPVLFIDTAGMDDVGTLGALRAERTKQIYDRTDLPILVLNLAAPQAGEEIWTHFEEEILAEFADRRISPLVVLTKADLAPVPQELKDYLELRRLRYVTFANPPKNLCYDQDYSNVEITEIRDALYSLVPETFFSPPPIVSDLLMPGEMAVLVAPIDNEAPKGRLILPQSETIRDLLDANCGCLVVTDDLLAKGLGSLNAPPRLVITDSQMFKKVSEIVPESVPLTSFSILMARQKGSLQVLAAGARKIGELGKNARILIAEACSHRPIGEDIGTVKIPRWLRARLGDGIKIGHVQGHDFPPTDEELAGWDLVIHCGACVWNRREMLQRISRCISAKVPITNYGMAIAFLHGILDRSLEIFELDKD